MISSVTDNISSSEATQKIRRLSDLETAESKIQGARDYANTICIFTVDGEPSTTLVQGQPPSSPYSHNINLFYMAQEALRLGCRVILHQKESENFFAVRNVFPVLDIISRRKPNFRDTDEVAVFSIYPIDIIYFMVNVLPSGVRRRSILIIPAVHWLESPELYPIHFIDDFRQALIYDIDDIIVQNKEMGEIIDSFAVLTAGALCKKRIHIAPCGFLPEDEQKIILLGESRAELRQEMGLADQDIAIINSGGVWKWTDLDVFLDAFIAFHREVPNNPLRFFVMGLRQSDNQDHSEYVGAFEDVLKQNQDLIDTGVIKVFRDWKDAGSRLPRYNHGADLGVNVSKASIENAQSFRQRFVEYVKAALPVINTMGDPMSRSAFRDMMLLVDPGRKESYLAAFRQIVDDPGELPKMRRAALALRGSLRTDKVYLPTIKKILSSDPISVESRQKAIELYSLLPSFHETKKKRGDLSGLYGDPGQLDLTANRGEKIALIGRAESVEVSSLQGLLGLSGENFIRGAYLTILGRQPDPSGLGYYLKQLALGDRMSSVLFDLARSPEARRRAEFSYLTSSSDEDFIDIAYYRILGRSPDGEGRRYYLDALRRGRSRSRIVRSLKHSPEAKRRGGFEAELDALLDKERALRGWRGRLNRILGAR